MPSAPARAEVVGILAEQRIDDGIEKSRALGEHPRQTRRGAHDIGHQSQETWIGAQKRTVRSQNGHRIGHCVERIKGLRGGGLSHVRIKRRVG